MNVKPRDLAILIVSPMPQYCGLIVEVLRAGQPAQFAAPFQRLSGPVWWVRSSRPCMTTHRTMLREFVLPDAALRPIRGDGITTEEVSELFSPSPAKESEKV